ncbi:MAG: class I SAM-dependent methyltransferase [Isosphaeraceae bacterium]
MNLDWVLDRIRTKVLAHSHVPFELRFWNGRSESFGQGNPAFQILVNNERGLAALGTLDELAICKAYLDASIDIKGDMIQLIELRRLLPDGDRLWNRLGRRLMALALGQVRTDRHAIAQHYEFDHDLYLCYLQATRCYSQAVFVRDDETLDEAQRRKLELALQACRIECGQHLLDVGAGWGTLTEYAGRKGIRVTSLTISQKSHEFVSDLIARSELPCQVYLQNFLEHKVAERYDAIAILGVMEHLPDYRAVLRQFATLLKPGGRVYLDAGAIGEKFKSTPFLTRYIYPANHSFFCLHDFLKALTSTHFELIAVHNDRHSYYLTCRAWAENFERVRDQIVTRWGEPLYRRFQLFLWGSAHAFLSRGLNAYRVVLESPRIS